MLVEPASGIILGASVADMVSVFTNDCNPGVDSSCKLGLKVGSNSRCYGMTMNVPGIGAVPVDFPCSAFNVFSPSVQGGKVIPIGWVRVGNTVDGTTSFGAIVQAKFLLDIMVIVVPIVCFLIILGIIIFEFVCKPEATVETFTNAENANANAHSEPEGISARANAYVAATNK